MTIHMTARKWIANWHIKGWSIWFRYGIAFCERNNFPEYLAYISPNNPDLYIGDFLCNEDRRSNCPDCHVKYDAFLEEEPQGIVENNQQGTGT